MTETRTTVAAYLRELAGVDESASMSSTINRIADRDGLPCRATLYRLVNANDCGVFARAVLDALDNRRTLAREHGGTAGPTTIDDYRNLTAGKIEVAQ